MASKEQREDLIDRLGRDAYITTFVASNRLTDEIEQLCRAEGISHAQYSALWVLCLADAPDGLPMGALVDGLLHRKADATRLVNILLDGGYVTREPSPGDRRVVLVKPTTAGQQLFERLTRSIKALHRRTVGSARQQRAAPAHPPAQQGPVVRPDGPHRRASHVRTDHLSPRPPLASPTAQPTEAP